MKSFFFTTMFHHIPVRTKQVRDMLEALSWEVLPIKIRVQIKNDWNSFKFDRICEKKRKNASFHHLNIVWSFIRTRLLHQTWLLPITTSFHWYVTYLLSSASVRTKMWKNGSTNGSQQKGKIFTGVVFTNCLKDGKTYNKWWSILWVKHFYHSYEFDVFFKEKNPHFMLVHLVTFLLCSNLSWLHPHH